MANTQLKLVHQAGSSVSGDCLFVERARNGCALHGALATFGAIEAAVPIIHATAGCGMQYHRSVTPFGGLPTFAASFGPPLSSTNIVEKHVVFGGGARLREQLKNTVKVVDADLYAVVTGCATEMVGDDIPAMSKEGLVQGFPLVYANTPGFAGSFYRGYQIALKTLIEQTPDIFAVDREQTRSRVNLLGIVPQHDPYWQGHLNQLAEALADYGIEVNPLLGVGAGARSWKLAPTASANVSVSFWGREAAGVLNERYGQTHIAISGLPVGQQAISALTEQLAHLLGLEKDAVTERGFAGEQLQRAYLARTAPQYFAGGFQRDFAIAGELSAITGIVSFLADSIGLIPKLAIATDNVPEDEREVEAAALASVLRSFDAQLLFSQDSGEIAAAIEGAGPQLVLGSSLEAEGASRIGVPFVPISFPLARRFIVNRGFVGATGALTLVEEVGSALLAKRAQ